jgi:xanthine dehydrogenase YagS FAD-binding subunit
MVPFRYSKPSKIADAIQLVSREESAAFVAGGTSLLNQLRSGERQQTHLVDITGLPLTGIQVNANNIRIGALERGAARNAQVRERFAVLAEALLSGASPQVRNMATPGGNLMQGLRKPFFHETEVLPGMRDNVSSGMNLNDGYRLGPIFGSGNAVYGADLGTALAALEATIIVQGARGERRIPISDFYLAPTRDGARETTLNRDELIIAIEISNSLRTRSTYLKARDRSSFAYMLVSSAVALEINGGVVRSARIALGGVASRPYRAVAAERAITGQRLTSDVIQNVATLCTQGATPKPENAFKVTLVQRTVARALEILGGAS